MAASSDTHAYNDTMQLCQTSTYDAVKVLKEALKQSKHPRGLFECDDEDTIVVSRKKIKAALDNTKSANRSFGSLHRKYTAEINRANLETQITRFEAIKDVVEREACYTHTLGVIQELEGLSTSVDHGIKTAAQINLMLGGLTSPPCLHYFDSHLVHYVHEQDLKNQFRHRCGPDPISLLKQFTAGVLDPATHPDSLAANNALLPHERLPKVVQVSKAPPISDEKLNESFMDFLVEMSEHAVECERQAASQSAFVS
tara:strand:+ start:263 stop:1030 length:768 start_codon:yes stop_codon:yes gene_type:complete